MAPLGVIVCVYDFFVSSLLIFVNLKFKKQA